MSGFSLNNLHSFLVDSFSFLATSCILAYISSNYGLFDIPVRVDRV
jgi:hypothetical protein